MQRRCWSSEKSLKPSNACVARSHSIRRAAKPIGCSRTRLLKQGNWTRQPAGSSKRSPWTPARSRPFSAFQSKKLGEADRPLVERMLARLEAGPLTETQSMRLHFALGKAFDDLQDYERAIGHFDAANRVRSRFYRLDRNRLARRVDRL